MPSSLRMRPSGTCVAQDPRANAGLKTSSRFAPRPSPPAAPSLPGPAARAGNTSGPSRNSTARERPRARRSAFERGRHLVLMDEQIVYGSGNAIGGDSLDGGGATPARRTARRAGRAAVREVRPRCWLFTVKLAEREMHAVERGDRLVAEHARSRAAGPSRCRHARFDEITVCRVEHVRRCGLASSATLCDRRDVIIVGL